MSERNRLSMPPDAIEFMQGNLNRGEPSIFTAYGLVGSIVLLGGVGFVADLWLNSKPWCLLAGLLAGLCLGFYQLFRALKHH